MRLRRGSAAVAWLACASIAALFCSRWAPTSTVWVMASAGVYHISNVSGVNSGGISKPSDAAISTPVRMSSRLIVASSSTGVPARSAAACPTAWTRTWSGWP